MRNPCSLLTPLPLQAKGAKTHRVLVPQLKFNLPAQGGSKPNPGPNQALDAKGKFSIDYPAAALVLSALWPRGVWGKK